MRIRLFAERWVASLSREWLVLLSRGAPVKDKAGFLPKAVKPRDKR